MTIAAVDPADEGALKEFWEVEYAAQLAGRPHGLSRSWQALQHTALPTTYFAHHFLTASEDGRVVGVADVGCGLQDNAHLATLSIAVTCEHRRRGVGRALHKASVDLASRLGRTTLIGEAHSTDVDRGAVDFGEALGFETVHSEDHLWIALPMAVQQRAALTARVAGASNDYELIT